MKIDRQHPVGARRGDEVGDQLGRDGRAWAGLPILTRIAEIGKDGGDPASRRAAQRVDHDQQFHQIVVRRERSRLEHEDILAADIFKDFDEDFLVREAPDVGLGQRRFEIAGHGLRERKV